MIAPEAARTTDDDGVHYALSWKTWGGSRCSRVLLEQPGFVPGFVILRLVDGTVEYHRENDFNGAVLSEIPADTSSCRCQHPRSSHEDLTGACDEVFRIQGLLPPWPLCSCKRFVLTPEEDRA